jgi:hypothetical protein
VGYILYGQVSFTSRARRDAAASTVTDQAAQRGFQPVAAFGYQPGVFNTSNTSFTMCYRHDDFAAIEAAEGDIMQVLSSNQYQGDFGWQAE